MKRRCRTALHLCLVLLLSGCAGLEKRQTYIVPDHKKQAIYDLVEEKSSVLKKTIVAEVESRHGGKAGRIDEVDASADQSAPGVILFRLLSSAGSEELLADEAFGSVYDIAGNGDIDRGATYALQLAKYLTVEDYHCKQPVYYQYFRNRYGGSRVMPICERRVPFNIDSNLDTSEIYMLDPGRVSAVHVLFAGAGESVISRFGHISIRLIICPEHDSSAEACNSNLYEHLVLGFRAHIDEFKIDPFKGVAGGYRAYLFANRFMDVYQDYAIGEFREVFSLPLKMDRQQRKDFVRAVSAIHWGYTGEYKLLTNNCSSLMQKVLSYMWGDFSHDPVMEELYWQPDSFFSELKKSPLTEYEKLGDLVMAEQQGFYFSSTKPVYETALGLVRDAMNDPGFASLDEYLNVDPALRYKNTLQDKMFYESIRRNGHLLDAQILLEELSIIKSERLMVAEMAYFFDNNDIFHIEQHMRNKLGNKEFAAFSDCVLSPLLSLIRPVKRKDGIPLLSDLDNDASETYSCTLAERTKYLKLVRREMGEIDRDNWTPVEVAAHYWTESIRNVERYTDLENHKQSNIR